MITNRYNLPHFYINSDLLNYLPLLFAAIVGAGSSLLMPSVIGAYTNYSDLNPSQISIMTSLEMLGVLITSASSFLWLRLINFHKVVFMMLMLLFMTNSINMLSVSLNWASYSLFIIRFLAGLETGIIYAIAVVAIAKQQNAVKLFSSLISCQIVYGTIGFSCIAAISQYLGLASIYIFFNFFILLTLIVCFFFDGFSKSYDRNYKQNRTLKNNYKDSQLLLKIVLAIVLYYVVQGSVWAYIEPIGISLGLTTLQIGSILSIGFTLSIVGSLWCLKIYKRLGQRVTVWLIICLQVICLLALNYIKASQWVLYLFAITTIVYQILWSLIVPLMMAVLCLIDNTKQYSAWSVSAFKIGLIVGPLLAATVINLSGYEILINISCILLVISGLLLTHALKNHVLKSSFK
ncbi:MFS transporter [Pseudoalteromonas prydzensis]|uniref:MFS transporter n=1 Tax=Pseudoalteromonas prydzensis TaxID=182141 RepID=UPI0007E4EFDD|nr:MFS transporter [Pseudoalteromonas prydzensis]MBE0379870.1 hypothetical protein [Pseudoalteromonas prydzensis ACAM 620]